MIDRIALAKKHGPTAIWQGKINDEWVVFWTWKWGWTTNQLIQRLLSVNRPRPADDFVRKGLLIKIEAPAGHGENHVYILSQEGYIKAQLMAEQSDPTRTSHYKLHTSRRVPFSLNSHNLTAQHVVMDLIGPADKSRPPAEWDYKKFKADYELRSAEEPNKYYPDFILNSIGSDGYKYVQHFEIETNQKANEKLHKWLWPRVKAANEPPMQYDDSEFSIVILTPFDGVVNFYSKQLTGKITRVFNNNGVDTFDHTQKLALQKQKIRLTKLTRDKERKSGGFSFDIKNAKYSTPIYTKKVEELAWDEGE